MYILRNSLKIVVSHEVRGRIKKHPVCGSLCPSIVRYLHISQAQYFLNHSKDIYEIFFNVEHNVLMRMIELMPGKKDNNKITEL